MHSACYELDSESQLGVRLVLSRFRAHLIVSLGCVVFGATALSPYAIRRSNLSDVRHKTPVCHPKGRSRTSAVVAPHLTGEHFALIDPPRPPKADSSRPCSIETTAGLVHSFRTQAVIWVQSRVPLRC